mgnify:FL=1
MIAERTNLSAIFLIFFKKVLTNEPISVIINVSNEREEQRNDEKGRIRKSYESRLPSGL